MTMAWWGEGAVISSPAFLSASGGEGGGVVAEVRFVGNGVSSAFCACGGSNKQCSALCRRLTLIFKDHVPVRVRYSKLLWLCRFDWPKSPATGSPKPDRSPYAGFTPVAMTSLVAQRIEAAASFWAMGLGLMGLRL